MISLRGLHADLRPYAEYAHRLANSYGVYPRVASVSRSWEEQQRLRTRYERAVASGTFPSAHCPYPANRPGDSAHNYGLAWDSVVEPEQQEFWTEVRRWVGFRVYGHDSPHAEYPDWRSLLH